MKKIGQLKMLHHEEGRDNIVLLGLVRHAGAFGLWGYKKCSRNFGEDVS
jgi:hypothetical protein